jgi:hypothetical protein
MAWIVKASHHQSKAGSLFVYEGMDFKRAFWIVTDDNPREFGMHGHKKNTQIIFAVKGKLQIEVVNILGLSQTFYLNNPNEGLLIEPMEWAKETPLEKGTIALVLCSHKFNQNDYIE